MQYNAQLKDLQNKFKIIHKWVSAIETSAWVEFPDELYQNICEIYKIILKDKSVENQDSNSSVEDSINNAVYKLNNELKMLIGKKENYPSFESFLPISQIEDKVDHKKDDLNTVEILALQNTTQLMLEKIKNIESNMRQLELKFIKELANVYKELIEVWKKIWNL